METLGRPVPGRPLYVAIGYPKLVVAFDYTPCNFLSMQNGKYIPRDC